MSADGMNHGFDFHELVVDSFAGGGGASTGILMALGRHPDIAVNHDGEALAMHEVNHPKPGTKHIREDVWAIDPEKAMGYRQVGLLWASPDCKHFSKAKGGKPVSKKIRGLAWVITKWAAKVQPRVIIMENVEEYKTAGPLIRIDGQWYPDPKRKGEHFDRFLARLRKLGYKVEHRELRACDYGAPTIRKRLFLIARRDGLPIVWPTATHGNPKLLPVQQGKLKPWRTAAECIDWSIPCPSIFERKRPLAEATLRRIARGIMRYVVDNPNPFIVPMQHQNRATPTDEPLQTVTTQGNKFTLVVPHVTKFRKNSIGSGCDEPLHTVTTGGDMKRPAGAAHAMGLVHAHLMHVTHHGEQRSHDLADPVPTVTGAQRGEQALVAATLIQAAHGEGKPGGAQRWGDGTCDPHAPVGTLTASNSHAFVAATLVQTGYGEREGQAPRAMDIEKPAGTVVAGASKQALVTAFLAQHNTDKSGVPKPGRSAEAPLSTIVGSGGQQQIVTAQLVGCGGRAGQSRPRDASETMGTITSKADTAVVASTLVKLRGTCKDGQPVDEPTHTVTGSGTHLGEVRAFLLKYYGVGSNVHSMEDPVSTVSSKDRIGLVLVHGEPYQIIDIGMRMLSPRELASAQGFPLSYIIDRGADGAPLTKTAQVRMIGNSVCPPVAAAIVAANFAHERGKVRKAA